MGQERRHAVTTPIADPGADAVIGRDTAGYRRHKGQVVVDLGGDTLHPQFVAAVADADGDDTILAGLDEQFIHRSHKRCDVLAGKVVVAAVPGLARTFDGDKVGGVRFEDTFR